MKNKKFILLLFSLLLIFSLFGCKNINNNTTISKINENKLNSDSLFVQKVENMPEDFILGIDMSSVISLEKSGVKFYDFEGKEEDIFKVVSDAGVNYIRVRVWNDPYDADGNGYGGGNNDINTCIEIGKRATKYGMKLLVDFHYSDFWADPAKQYVPKAWKSLKIDAKAEALYNFTKDCLIKLKDENIEVGMVQIGNETNAYLCGEKKWANIAKLMEAGSKATREILPDALVAIHFANPEKTANYLDYAMRVDYYDLDYDVFGTSYYPYWHGTLDNLSTVLSEIATKYNKKVMVMETSYANTGSDSDGWPNTIGDGGDFVKNYPFTIAGQTNCIRDIIDTIVNKTTNGIGVCYWEGAWITVGSNDKSQNMPIWEEFGSGWASSYAKDYDPNDAGKWYGGSAVDNQAFFDPNGKPYESLKLFNLVRYGNNAPKYIDGVLDSSVTINTNDSSATLPSKVSVVYSDNSKSEVDVTWEAFNLDEARAKGNGKYSIKGTASGYEVYCNLTILEKNFITDYSFEDKSEAWINTINAGTLSDTHKVQITAENPQTGKNAFHFWTSDSDGVNFDLSQIVELTSSGTYKVQVSVLGGGNGSSSITESKENVYIYVKINDEIKYTKKVVITCYSDGYKDYLLEGIEYKAGDKLEVGIHVEISEANCWGDIDDFMLNFVN